MFFLWITRFYCLRIGREFGEELTRLLEGVKKVFDTRVVRAEDVYRCREHALNDCLGFKHVGAHRSRVEAKCLGKS